MVFKSWLMLLLVPTRINFSIGRKRPSSVHLASHISHLTKHAEIQNSPIDRMRPLSASRMQAPPRRIGTSWKGTIPDSHLHHRARRSSQPDLNYM